MKMRYYFLKEDLDVLEKMAESLKNKIVKIGKEQGEVARQSTENMGHDDACQEVIYQERRIAVSRLDEIRQILNNAECVKPISASEKVRFGSIVKLDNGKIYKIGSYRILANHSIENISYNSPLGEKLLNKEIGDEIVHNSIIITITNIK
ncbi:MAG: GreA/GreB family elongation factor [Patescibacteria group bacterium]